jgi:transcriptional regulator with AAA-type ATPase domain
MEQDVLTTLKILIIGESGVGKSRSEMPYLELKIQ